MIRSLLFLCFSFFTWSSVSFAQDDYFQLLDCYSIVVGKDASDDAVAVIPNYYSLGAIDLSDTSPEGVS